MQKEEANTLLLRRLTYGFIIFYSALFIGIFIFAFNSGSEERANEEQSKTRDSNRPYKASDVLGQTDFTSSTTAATAQNFAGQMTGVTIDETEHRLFVGDYSNHRVLVFSLDESNKLVDKTADFVLGQPDFTSSKAGVTESTLGGPTGVTFDSARKRLFVSDGYGSNNRILIFDLSTGITNGMAASYVLGQPNFTSKIGGASLNKMQDNGSVSFDQQANRLFVADYGNSRVLVFDLAQGLTNGMDAKYVLGESGSSLKNVATTRSSMSNPWGVHFDTALNRLYVADFSNNRVLIFDLSTGITNGMAASYVLGQPNFTSNTYATTQDQMYNPLAITTAKSGKTLFIHDGSSARVLVFDVESITNGEKAVDVLGKPSFTGEGKLDGRSMGLDCEVSQTEICYDGYDASMYFDDKNQKLYVSDSNAHRVLVFDYRPEQ